MMSNLKVAGPLSVHCAFLAGIFLSWGLAGDVRILYGVALTFSLLSILYACRYAALIIKGD